MGRNSPNLGTNQTTSTSRKKCQQKQGRKQLLDLKLFNQQEAGDRIHQPKQVSHAVNNLTSFTLCLKQKENRGEQSNDREDEEDLMKNIQILLDSHPKCNFVQQILQRLCDEGKMTEEMMAYFIDRSIRRQREIQKQISCLKNGQSGNSTTENERQQADEISRESRQPLFDSATN